MNFASCIKRIGIVAAALVSLLGAGLDGQPRSQKRDKGCRDDPYSFNA